MAPLKVEIVGIDALGEADWAEWRAMLAANPALASPYFRPEFARIAGGVSPQSAVAVFSRGGRTVGFFPHQRRGGAVQPLAAPMNDYHGVIAFPDAMLSLRRFHDRVTRWMSPTEARWFEDVVHLDPIDGDTLAAFFTPDVERESRRRARRDHVGAGRDVERIVSGAILAECRDTEIGRKYAADVNGSTVGAAQTWASGYMNSFQAWSYAKNAFDKWSMLLARRLAELRGVAPKQ